MSFPRPLLPKRNENDYRIGELLGRGNFVTVYRADDLPTGQPVALKVVDRYRCTRLKKTQDLVMEKHCLQRLNHPNIVKMLAHFTDTLTVYVVMEECLGGELWDIVKVVGLPDAVARFYIAQMLNAVEYLRQARIVHRDLKAENVMLTAVGVVKIIDFGTAKDLENPHIKGSGNVSRKKVFEDYVGTAQFMPHEVIENKCSDFRSDTWSLGCLMFQMLCGIPPFQGLSEYLIFMRIMDMDLKFPPGINPQAEDLIRKIVVKDQDSRLGAHNLEEIRQHPYLTGVSYEGAHTRPQPVRSLADLCLERIGRNLKELGETVKSWAKRSSLRPELQTAVERLETVQKWTDDATPPEDQFD